MNRACCTQETAVQLLVVPIKSEILTMVTAYLSSVERGSGFLGKIASWEGRGCSQQELGRLENAALWQRRAILSSCYRELCAVCVCIHCKCA